MISLSDGRSELYQWDTKRTLKVDFDCSQVHFSNKPLGRSIDVDVVNGVAEIPDIFLQSCNDLMAWAFSGTPENGYTKIAKVFKVVKRNKPSDYVFTPPEQTTLGEIVERIEDLEEMQDPEAIKNAVDDYLANNPIHVKETDPTVPAWAKQPQKPSYTAAEVGALSQSQLQSGINTALAQAKASGEFDGDPGYSPTAKVTQTATGATVTITDKTGTTKATIANGKDGKDGADGEPGQPGKDGDPGKDGVSATHKWSGTTLTITSASGTSSADLKGDKGDKGDTGSAGANGKDGKDGTSVTVKSVSESSADGGSNVVAFSDGKTLTVRNGSKGSPGDNYVLTAADKEEIAEQAASLVEVPESTMEPLTFTGAVNATYDGSKAVSVEIPKGSGGSGGGTEKEWVLITDTVLTEAAHSVTFTQLPNGEAFGFSELMVYGAAVCNVGSAVRSFGILANGKWIAQIPESVHKAGANISDKLFFYKGIIENGTINGISTNPASLAQQVSGRNTLSMVTLVDYEKINSVRVEPNTSADDFGAGTWFRIFGR